LRDRPAASAASAIVAIAGAAAIGWWVFGYLRPAPVAERPLGLEQFPSVLSRPTAATGGGSSFTKATPAPVEAPGLWPWFRGPARDNIASSGGKMQFDWQARPPAVAWSVQLGEGYAGPAVRRGRVYVIDYDQAGQADAVRCFALTNGDELWRRSYPVVVKRNHGLSRTIPSVTDKHVVTLGPKCHLSCLNADTGTMVWQHDLVAEYGVTVPEWYAGQCPLVDGDRVVIGTGGQALLMAFDIATGKVVWKTPNPRNWVMTHSSVQPVTVGGVSQYVWCGSGGVVGVSARDGKLLWENLDWVINTATVPTPVPMGEGKLMLTGGYDSGAAVMKLARSGAAFTATMEARFKPNVFGSDQQTPVYYKGLIYGVKPGGQLVCFDPAGRALWSSGTDRFGLAPYLVIDDTILAMSDSGNLTAARTGPSAYDRISQIRVLEGPEAWGPIAVAGTRLIVRDLHKMVCLELAKR
jgi:outer membrane protein assembly factor BamB